jgi:hypothetical protein
MKEGQYVSREARLTGPSVSRQLMKWEISRGQTGAKKARAFYRAGG